MKYILTAFIILNLYNEPLLAQEVSNTLEDKNELGVPKLKFHAFSASKDFNLKHETKKLAVKPYNSFQKNIGMYKGPNNILLRDSVSQDLALKNLKLDLVYNMPIFRPQKKLYILTIEPSDPRNHHHILRKMIDNSLLNQE